MITISGIRTLAGLTFSYRYLDNQYFLTCATGPWGPAGASCAPTPSADALQWTYDRIGNRLSETRTIEVAPPPEEDSEGSIHTLAPITQADTYTYVQNTVPANTPILATIDRDGSTAATYTYGAGGHLEEVNRGANVIDFIPDAAGRLSGLDRLGEMANFTYDGRSFLREALRPLGGGDQATTDPVYSSEGLLYCLTRQEDAAATPETVDYFYFAGRPVAQRHSEVATDTWTFLTADHLGTPAIATNLTGEEIWLGPFEPFGRDYLAGTLYGAADNGLFLRLPGQWDDGRWTEASLGADLYYNVHRWYEPAIGIYSRADPLGLRASGPLKLYVYAEANSLFYKDPFGLCSCEDDCPSGTWNYLGGSLGFSWGGGIAYTRGTYQCEGKPSMKVKVSALCGVVGLALWAGGDFTTASIPAACSCTAEGLTGRKNSFFYGGGPLSKSLSSCFGKKGRSGLLGIAASASFSIGGTFCDIKRR